MTRLKIIYIDLESIADDLIEKGEEAKNLMKEKNIGKTHPIYVQYVNRIKDVGEKLKKELAMKSERVFLACFSEVKSSLLMWAHYASSHKGICIEYNYKELSKIFGATNIVPIEYTNVFFRIVDWNTFIEHHEIFIKMVKRKSIEWSYEKEWRLIGDYKINLPYNKGELHKAPKPCAIYLGVNISSDIKAKIIEICKEKQINLYQMRLSEKGYRLLSFKVDL